MTQYFASALLLVTFATQAASLSIKDSFPLEKASDMVLSQSNFIDTENVMSSKVGLAQVDAQGHCEPHECPDDFDFWCRKSVWHNLWNSIPDCNCESDDNDICICNNDFHPDSCIPSICDHTTCPPVDIGHFNPFDALAQSMVAIFDSSCHPDGLLNKEEARQFFFFALQRSGSVYNPEEFDQFWQEAHTEDCGYPRDEITWHELAEYMWEECFDDCCYE